MSQSPRAEPSPLSLALGRVPSGIFILTAGPAGLGTGMLASWVQQAGFEPPMLTVAIRRDRPIGDQVAGSGRFVLNQLPTGSKHLLRHFARGFEPGAPAFDGVPLLDDPTAAAGGPVLAEALAFLDCRVAGQIESGDHRIVLAQVVAGALIAPDAEPMVHVRHSGMHY